MVVLAGLLVLDCGAPRTPPSDSAAEPAPVKAEQTRPKVVFFDPGDYAGASTEGLAGTEACAACHETQYAHWLRTPHARAFADAAGPDGTVPVRCRRCHASVLVCPEEDEPRLHLDLRAVGCEACHGQGRDHAGDPESASGTISGVRDDCGECNFRGLCQVCHNTEGDPDFKYFAAYRRARHPGPGEDSGGEDIPLEETGGPACGRGMN